MVVFRVYEKMVDNRVEFFEIRRVANSKLTLNEKQI